MSYSDGGDKVRVARLPVTGRAAVAKFVASFVTKLWYGVTAEPSTATGAPALRLLRNGVTFGILTVEVSTEGIDRIFWILNPEKLRTFA